LSFSNLKILEFDAEAINLKAIRENLRGIFSEQNIDKNIADEMVIALNEACMNIIQHAYKGAAGKIQIKIEKNATQWRFELIDFAPAVDIKSIKAKDLAEVRPGGLGVNFIYQIMDSVDYQNIAESGNRLVLIKKIS